MMFTIIGIFHGRNLIRYEPSLWRINSVIVGSIPRSILRVYKFTNVNKRDAEIIHLIT